MNYVRQTGILLSTLTFFVLGLLINFLQLLFYLVLPRDYYLSVNYYLVYCIYAYLMFLGDWWSGSEVRFFCDSELKGRIERGEGEEHTVIIMNHHTELDWLYSWMVGDRMGVLGNCRVFAKHSLKYAPIIGWAWALSDVIFLRRDWKKDEATMAEKLEKLYSYPSPVWLLIFPEGTRFSHEKHKASQEFAQKEGNEELPSLKHHLIPRTKGFNFLVEKINREKVKNIYDVTLVEDPNHAHFSMANLLAGKKTVGNIYVRRIPMEDIPRDAEGSSKWLMKLFEEKDALKSNYLSTGSFKSNEASVCPAAKPWSLLLVLVTNILFLVPLFFHIIFFSGWKLKILSLLLLLLTTKLVDKLTSIAQISKASKYGTNNNHNKFD